MIATNTVVKGNRFYPCMRCSKEHPSLTTLLSVIASPALMGWMSANGTKKLKVLSDVLTEKMGEAALPIKTLAEVRWKEKEKTAFWKSGKEVGEEAADIGAMCHGWLEAHLQGRTPSMEDLPPEGQKAVGSMLKWEREHHLETLKTEETFYNCKLNYAGTADWVGRLDGQLSLGDWKTSSGIWVNYLIQVWGYALADETQNAERLYSQVFVGRFGKDGTSEVRISRRSQFPSIEEAREVIIGCGVIFSALKRWDQENPWKRSA